MKILVLISICVLWIVIFSVVFLFYKFVMKNIDANSISETKFISCFVLYAGTYFTLCLLIFNSISIVTYVDKPIYVKDLKDASNVYAKSIDFKDYNDNDKIIFSIRDDLSYSERLRICFHVEKSDLECTVVKKN